MTNQEILEVEQNYPGQDMELTGLFLSGELSGALR